MIEFWGYNNITSHIILIHFLYFVFSSEMSYLALDWVKAGRTCWFVTLKSVVTLLTLALSFTVAWIWHRTLSVTVTSYRETGAEQRWLSLLCILHFTCTVYNITFRLVSVFFHTLTWLCGVTVVVSIFTVLTLGASAVIQALKTLPCSAVTVADSVLIHVAMTLARLTLFGRAILSHRVSIETIITDFTTGAFKKTCVISK